ncbi:hypothetical protein AB1Y20_019781 [Prymnesium parvum]|uniref:THO complex subunit 3 n=1 Tax=Prymnesium parvum TaxID=97485 RepID=A0AB34JVF5_PRYPA
MAAVFKGCTIREYLGHKKKVHTVSWNSTGAKLASGSVDQSVHVWALDETGRSVDTELKGHQESVDQLRWEPVQPDVLSTASADKTVRIWDTRMSKCAQAIETRGENINIRWSPDGQHLAVGDKEDNISLIEMRKCKVLKNMKFGFEVNEMAWEQTGKLFFLTTGAGTVEVFLYADMLRQAEPSPVHTLHAHTANCYCIEFSSDGEKFAVGGADALVSIWNVKELVCEVTCSRLEWPVRTLSFSHDCNFIASGSEDPLIDIANVATSEQAHVIPCSAAMNTVAWNPKRLLLAFAGDDKDKLGREGVIRVFGYSS